MHLYKISTEKHRKLYYVVLRLRDCSIAFNFLLEILFVVPSPIFNKTNALHLELYIYHLQETVIQNIIKFILLTKIFL